MPLGGISAELRVEPNSKSKQRRCSGPVPVADEAARIPPSGHNRLGQLLWLKGG